MTASDEMMGGGGGATRCICHPTDRDQRYDVISLDGIAAITAAQGIKKHMLYPVRF